MKFIYLILFILVSFNSFSQANIISICAFENGRPVHLIICDSVICKDVEGTLFNPNTCIPNIEMPVYPDSFELYPRFFPTVKFSSKDFVKVDSLIRINQLGLFKENINNSTHTIVITVYNGNNLLYCRYFDFTNEDNLWYLYYLINLDAKKEIVEQYFRFLEV